jgi:hypothetical protein
MEPTTTMPAPVPATMNGSAVTLAQPQGNPLAMPVPVQAVIARHEAIQEIIRGVFKDGIHFGKIPGTGDKKTLLKPGFDTLCEAFQFSPDFVKQSESIETDKFVNLVYKCALTSASGRVVATGIGSCNSKEEKYRWTTMARKCPNCKAETIIKGKQEYGGGWVCFDKKGGCKSKFRDGDQAIEGQPAGRIENDNAWNFHNTLTKMAQKRAGMAAIITACGISGDFTQDMEDFGPIENAKNARREEGIDVQSNREESRPYEDMGGADVYPWPGSEQPTGDWRQDAQAAAAHVEDAQFSEATTAPAVPEDIRKAQEDVGIGVRNCKTRADYQSVASKMRKAGGVYQDARVTAIFNTAYYAAFPKTTNAPSAP